MPVNGVSNTQASSLAYVRNDVSASAGELTMTDFYHGGRDAVSGS